MREISQSQPEASIQPETLVRAFRDALRKLQTEQTTAPLGFGQEPGRIITRPEDLDAPQQIDGTQLSIYEQALLSIVEHIKSLVPLQDSGLHSSFESHEEEKVMSTDTKEPNEYLESLKQKETLRVFSPKESAMFLDAQLKILDKKIKEAKKIAINDLAGPR